MFFSFLFLERLKRRVLLARTRQLRIEFKYNVVPELAVLMLIK